jgi:ribonuclease BN (tRNA processing enzyme)
VLLKTIATGSSGNCHALITDTGEILLLDLGENEKKIKKGIGWKISDVVGAIVTHKHADHSKSVNDFERMGIPIFKPYENTETFVKQYSGFKIQAFDLTTIDGRWTHTDADGMECPCYGFLIEHKEMGRMLYITDTAIVKWRFKNINHILLGVNYDKDMIHPDNEGKKNHIFGGHMEIETACEFVKANNSNSLHNVIMCHLSADNADSDKFIERMKEVCPTANVYVAGRNDGWWLSDGKV